MENKHKVYIGLGVVALGAIAYYYVNKKKDVEFNPAEKEVKSENPAVEESRPKKELSQKQADEIAAKIFKTKKTEMVAKFSTGYVSPTIGLLKQLTDGGWTYLITGKAVKVSLKDLGIESGTELQNLRK